MRDPTDRQPIPRGTRVEIRGETYEVGAQLWTGEYVLRPAGREGLIVKPEQIAYEYYTDLELGKPIG